MTRLYKKQIMKPLIRVILRTQLGIEQEFLPNFADEADWNHQLFKFSWDEFIRARSELRRKKEQEQTEGIENSVSDLIEPEPIISQEEQLKKQKCIAIKRILLLRMHADLSRYLTQFFTGYRRSILIRSAIN